MIVVPSKNKNPLKGLIELREKIRNESSLFTTEEIKKMIKESKKEWSKSD
jgi:hypothetical protein